MLDIEEVNQSGFVTPRFGTPIYGQSGIQISPTPPGVTVGIQSGGLTSGLYAPQSIGIGHLQSGLQLSGLIQSGGIGSGAVTGHAFAGYFVIASGTLGTNDYGSGSVVSGTIASGQIGFGHLANASVASGTIASGQVSTYTIASGTVVPFSEGLANFYSGSAWTALTVELISGVRAVALTQSGYIQMAMAAVSGRNPAIGIVWDNVQSGIQANVYSQGSFQQVSSGLLNFSGFIGQALYLGRSGQVSPVSGWFSSGGFSSGDIIQLIGTAINSGAANFNVQSPYIAAPGVSVTQGPYGIVIANTSGAGGGGALTSGSVQSGHIASGAVEGYFGPTRQIASGSIGVWDFGSGAVIAGAIGSGAVVSGNIASGYVNQFAMYDMMLFASYF